jgi:hypothetical protein
MALNRAEPSTKRCTKPKSMMLLLDRHSPPITDPPWATIADALSNLKPDADGVTLFRHGKERLHAQGARLRLTIRYWASDESATLMVGRRPENGGRCRPTLCDNRVLLSPYETWTADDAIAAFRTFFEGRDLAESYVLRDPNREYSREEIENIILRRT